MEIRERIRLIIHIRLTRPQDVHALPAIERSAGESFRSLPLLAWIADDGDMPAEVHLQFAMEGTSWVAEVDGHLVGFLCARVEGKDLHVEELAVRQEWQGQGIGRGLMNASIEHARDHALRSITLTTFRDVAWNGPFYRSLGFRVIPVEEMEARLKDMLRDEVARGFPSDLRCAMRLWISELRENQT